MATLMPSVFFGRGNPMNAIASNAYRVHMKCRIAAVEVTP